MGTEIGGGSGELLSAELRACFTDSQNLPVSGRIVSLGDAVRAFGDDLTVLYDDGAERQPASRDLLANQVDGVLREIHGSSNPIDIGAKPFRHQGAWCTSSIRAGPVPLVGSVFQGQSLERNGASAGSNASLPRLAISRSMAARPPPPRSSTSIK